MKIEKREDGITLVSESNFELEVLRYLRNNSIKNKRFEDDWEGGGKFYIDFDMEWGL
jgi:hypothetical protein